MTTRSFNTALQVYGDKRLAKRIDNVSARQFQKTGVNVGSTMAFGARRIITEMLKRVPVVSGRLYRSFRFRIVGNLLYISYNTPYAHRVEQTSRRNKRYMIRGANAGVRAANAGVRSISTSLASRGAPAPARFRRVGPVMRKGKGGIEVTFQYG